MYHFNDVGKDCFQKWGITAATTYTVTSDAIGNPTNDGTWSYT